MGVPMSMCGRAGWELYGLGKKKLIRVETLVLGEGVRRGLELERYVVKMMRYGFMTKDFKALNVKFSEEIYLPEKRWARELRILRAKERAKEVKEREKAVKELLQEEHVEWEELGMMQEDVD